MLKKNVLIDIGKKLSHITLKHPDSPRAVTAHPPGEFFKALNSFMCPFRFAARITVKDKTFVKIWHEYSVHSVVEYSILHACLMYLARLRISNSKRLVISMLVAPVYQFLVQQQQIFFRCHVILHNISTTPFVFLELSPSNKQVFFTHYFLKQTMKATPPPARNASRAKRIDAGGPRSSSPLNTHANSQNTGTPALIQKIFLWCVLSHTKVEKLPKFARYSLGLPLYEQSLATLDLAVLFSKKQVKKSKLSILEKLDANIQALKYKVRILAETKAISAKSQAYLVEQLIEIGKIIGGAIKNTKEEL
jgi:hypothetical protein